LHKEWYIAPRNNAEFVCAMEDVLDIYQRPYDKKYPVVCMDESSKQLLREVRSPLLVDPGKPERYDTEYERNGTCTIFMFFEPLKGQRQVCVNETSGLSP
jgi:hypothetical protein